jgi:hypothetical protein
MRKVGRAVVLCGLLAILPWPVRAQQLPLADIVKAAQLYKFASFISWPESAFASASEPMRICVVEDPTFAVAVARATRTQTVHGRAFLVRNVEANDSAECRILFIPSNVAPDVSTAVLARTMGTPVLTVTDGAEAASRGIINFVIRDSRVRFEIDNPTAQRGGLTVSSQLLSLAASNSSQ